MPKINKNEVDLKIYRDDVYHCAKCHMCKSIDFDDIQSERFSEICPSGFNGLFEAYFSSGKMELARAIMNNELKDNTIWNSDFAPFMNPILKNNFIYIIGLYSRHGRFYPPYNFIPDINWGEFMYNFLN